MTRLFFIGVPFLLFALALVLRGYHLTHEPLWLDEGYTLLFSGMPLDKLLTVGGAHEHPPLFYFLVHVGRAIHDSTMMPRMLAALCGALGVVALFFLGKRLYGPVAGMIAAALMAIAPIHVFYSQDGRGYELASLLVILSYLSLFTAFESRRARYWCAYAVLTAACMWCEYITLLVIIPQALVLWRAWRGGQGRAVLLSVAGGVALFLPWVAVFMQNAYHISADYWIPPPNPTEVSNTFLEFVGLEESCTNSPCQGQEIFSWMAGHEVLIASILVGLALIVGIVGALRRNLIVSVLILWLLLPFAIILGLYLSHLTRSFYLDRVFLDATFPIYLLIGGGLVQLRWRAVVAGVVALGMILLSGPQIGVLYAGGYNPDWRSLGRDLGAAYRPGQSIFFNPGVLQSLVPAYLPTTWNPTLSVPLWSRTYLDVPGWQQKFPIHVHPLPGERRAVDQQLRDYQLGMVTSGHHQVWLVTYDYTGMNDTRRWLADHGYEPIVSELYEGDTRLELWSDQAPSRLGPAVVPDDGLRSGWTSSRQVARQGGTVTTRGRTVLTRKFDVHPGTVYSVAADYRGIPPASKPAVSLRITDQAGKEVAVFPRTMWYDWPVTGVWLSQPFGFVAPPNSAHATLTITTAWGQASWRHVAVYAQR